MQQSDKTIFFVAPSTGEFELTSKFLAGSKKIRFMIQLLAEQGYSIVLINSAPAMGIRTGIQIDQLVLSDQKTINRLTIPTYKLNKIGRLRNIFEASKILNRAMECFGTPNLIWCYNGYSFEMRFAKEAARHYNVPIILEFEDWHFARSGPLNPKATLDYFFWRRALKFIRFCYAVNPWLASLMRKQGINVELLPGVVGDEITKIRAWTKPTPNSEIRVGYFGGLTEEKGAGFVLKLVELANSLSLPIRFDVTGSGELTEEFVKKASQYPSYLNFHGVVNEKCLCYLMEISHVLLNPHVESKGVLPFKLLEGVAAGRPIISGPISIAETELAWMLSGVEMLGFNAKNWLNSILDIPKSNHFSERSLRDNKLKALALYTRDQLMKSVSENINILLT